jgi:hypothetical protein
MARSLLHRTAPRHSLHPISLPLLTVHCDEQIEFILCHFDELLNLSEPDSLLDLIDVLLLLADRQAVLRQTAHVLVVQRLELSEHKSEVTTRKHKQDSARQTRSTNQRGG